MAARTKRRCRYGVSKTTGKCLKRPRPLKKHGAGLEGPFMRTRIPSVKEVVRAARDGGIPYNRRDETSRCRALHAAKVARRLASITRNPDLAAKLRMVARDAEFDIDRSRLPGQHC